MGFSCFGKLNSIHIRIEGHVITSNLAVVSSGGAPTPAGTSVFTKHNRHFGIQRAVVVS